jgi:MinD superfamily P-loop ATPase
MNRFKWEPVMLRRVVQIDQSKCTQCERCVSFCPTGVVALGEQGAYLTDERQCDGLGGCLEQCPVGAIRLEMKRVPAFPSATAWPNAPAQSIVLGRSRGWKRWRESPGLADDGEVQRAFSNGLQG